VGSEIPLVVGNNEISVTVSVMNDAYRLYSNLKCIIEKNPTFYRVEGTHDANVSNATKQAKSSFTVCLDDKPATKAMLDKYTWSVNAKDPDGNKATVNTVQNSDGTFDVTLTANPQSYGKYSVEFKIVSPDGMSRSKEVTHLYLPESTQINVTIPTVIPSGSNNVPISFSVMADGSKLSKDNLQGYNIEIKVTDPSGSQSSATPSISSDGIVNSELKAIDGIIKVRVI
jgi:hypothetical protein